MARSSVPARPDSGFVDALTGPDGTGDPPPPAWRSDRFDDALAAPAAEPGASTTAATGPGSGLPVAAVAIGSSAVGAQPTAAASPGVVGVPSASPGSVARRSGGAAAAHQRNVAARAARTQSAGPAAPYASVPAAPYASIPAVTYPSGPPVGYPSASPLAPPIPYLASPTPQRQPAVPPRTVQYTATSYQPAPPTRPPARPAGYRPPGRQGTTPKKKSGASGCLTFLIFVVIALFATGLGRTILDALSNLISQWTR